MRAPTAQEPTPSGDGLPWLRVHELTEFAFCPRAGVCTFEKGCSEEEEEGLPAAAWIPWEEDQLIRSLKQANRELLVLLVTAAGGMVLFSSLASFFHPYYWVMGVVTALWFGAFAVDRLRKVAALNKLLRALQQTAGREPDLNNPGHQPVSLWGLLKAGFTSDAVLGDFQDPVLMIRGKPNRVLRKGSVRIPVWRLPTDDRKLWPQHIVRMAAYAHLLEKSEQGTSPYGVILYHKSQEGVAIVFSDAAKKRFQEALETARAVMAKPATPDGLPPPDANLCRGCPHGFPVLYHVGETEHRAKGELLPVCGALDASGNLYHSLCGDRFWWLPPHLEKETKGLKI